MTYLILAILSSFAISMLIKWNESAGANTPVVIAANYLSASALGWLLVAWSDSGLPQTVTLLFGLGGGILWPVGFFLLMWGIRNYGMSLAGTACRLSLGVPVLFGLLFLRERLTGPTLLGLLATLIALVLFNPVRPGDLRRMDRRALWFFPFLAFFFGVVDLWVNLFNHLGPRADNFLFATFIFTFSGMVAWAGLAVAHIRPDRDSVRRGLILGLPNFLTTFFLMESLKTPLFQGQSAVAYTLYSVAGVVLAFAGGALLWRERVTPSNLAGAALAAFAIVLLNQ
jgi:multidrug transporter EmrE-like cation transporter